MPEEKSSPGVSAAVLMRRQATQHVDVFSTLAARSTSKTRSLTAFRTKTASQLPLGGLMKNQVHLGTVRPPVDYFMTKLRRNFVTGAISMEDAEAELDFQYVDLYERSSVTASGLRLLEDEYIYRAEPLVRRSWLYQSLFELEHSTERREELFTQGQIPIKSQSRIRLDALQAAVHEGQTSEWSPVLATTLALVTAALSGNAGLLASVAGLFLICLGVAVRGNDAERADTQRLLTIWLRLGWLIWRVVSSDYGGLTGVLQIATMVLVAADVLANDVAKLVRQKLLATKYQLVKTLPGKVFVVIEKKWANEFKGCDYPATIVGEDVLELMHREDTDQEMKIDVLADVHGILCKLVPTTKTDLDDLLDIQAESGEPTRLVYCTNTFNSSRPTANDVSDKHKIVETFKKNRTSTVMKRGYTSLKRPSIEE